MNNTEFYGKLAVLLDVDAVQEGSVLRDFDTWDSLSVLSVLAMIDSSYGVTLAPHELAAAVTAADLCNCVASKVRARG